MNQDKMQMFVERYLELSNELKYRKGEGNAYMQLGEILTQKQDYDTSAKNFYRAMKIAEDHNDTNNKETAKVNYGLATASLNWNEKIHEIMTQVDSNVKEQNDMDDEDNVVNEANADEEYEGN